METIRMNVHSQEYMETMARLMSEALESPEGTRALAAAMEPLLAGGTGLYFRAETT